MTPHRLASELGLDPADPTTLATCSALSANINRGNMNAADYRTEVLRVLHQHGEQELAAIHSLCNRPQKDISLLPIVGKLVNDGLIEKVTAPRPGHPLLPPGPMRSQRDSRPVPVRFRITDAGRKLLQ
jgi:hypothetical protein